MEKLKEGDRVISKKTGHDNIVVMSVTNVSISGDGANPKYRQLVKIQDLSGRLDYDDMWLPAEHFEKDKSYYRNKKLEKILGIGQIGLN